MSYEDPRLVDLYDEDNPDGPDHDYYRSLTRDASGIVDLGCGTGILTVTLAGETVERTVVGIDPSGAMLDYARGRPGAEKVTWIQGDSRNIPPHGFDLAIMTGNVAQHIPDSNWARTLNDLHRSLIPGGPLAFESRNPAVRAWEGWDNGEKTSRMTKHGELVEWEEFDVTDHRTVRMVAHNHFVATGDIVTESQTLIFRSEIEIREDLQRAGFSVEAVYGNWVRTPFEGASPIMVFVARAV